MSTPRETAVCGICGQPLDSQHDHQEKGAGRRVEYVVVSRRNAGVQFQVVGDESGKTYKFLAADLAEQLGIDDATIVGRQFSAWVEPAEYGIIRSDFRLEK